MFQAICPVNPEWVHNYIVVPYEEGTERLNRAWQGIDFHHVARPTLSIQERLISLGVGVSLMLPFINSIIWLAWQTFGRPEKLSCEFNPDNDIPEQAFAGNIGVEEADREADVIAPALQVELPTQKEIKQELFSFNYSTQDSVERANWKIEFFKDLFVVTSICKSFASTSVYNPDWTIREFHYQKKEGDVYDYWLRAPRQLEIHIEKKKVKTVHHFELEEPLVWMQQPTLGFRNFILSNETQFYFYGILPQHPLPLLKYFSTAPVVMKALAKKVGEEEVPGFGKLMKVEVTSDWGYPYNSKKGEFWFDPPDGERPGMLRKFNDPLTPQVGEFVQNNR